MNTPQRETSNQHTVITDGQFYELLTPYFSYDCNIFRTITPDGTSPM